MGPLCFGMLFGGTSLFIKHPDIVGAIITTCMIDICHRELLLIMMLDGQALVLVFHDVNAAAMTYLGHWTSVGSVVVLV